MCPMENVISGKSEAAAASVVFGETVVAAPELPHPYREQASAIARIPHKIFFFIFFLLINLFLI